MSPRRGSYRKEPHGWGQHPKYAEQLIAAHQLGATPAQRQQLASPLRSCVSDPQGIVGSPVFDFPSLVAKLRHIEALFAGATTPGERDAADAARDRIQQRLAELAAASPPVELTYTLQNPWSKMLFVALARRYGLKPYRYRRQRYTTVTLRVSPRFSDETLWPEFLKLDRELMSQLDTLTQQVIAQAIHADTSDAAEREGQLSLPDGGA